MSAAADFDVSSWLTGEKSVPFSSVSSSSNDSLYAPLSIHVPDTKTMDHQLGLFSPLLLNEPQSMNLQTPTAQSSTAPFPFLHQNDNIKMENDSSVDEQPTNNLPAFDHGLSINSSISTTIPPVVDHLSSSHLSPLSDASSPSDFEVDRYHPISPLSPSISGTQNDNGYYQSVDQIFEDDDYQSPSTSPASPASSEISALSEATTNPNSASSTIHSAATDNNQQPKLSKTGGKKKRAKRRNLLNALKEHLASSTTNANNHSSNGEEGTSESESELMHELTNRSTRTRGKRSASSVADDNDDKDDPVSKRERNKQSASAYRKRRKMYLDTLESKVEVLNEKLTEQQQSMAKMENENKVLREQVSFLKRLISFKTANNESETKESDDNAMHISSSSSSSFSSGAFGATNSRLNLLNYSTTRSTNAGMFLFLLFSCFLLFNPMWSNDLSIHNDGSSMEPVGRISRKLLSYEDLSDPLNAAVYSSVKKEDYMNQYFYGFPTQSTDTVLNHESSAPSSSAAARSKNNHSEDVPLSSSSSSSSSVRYPLTEVSDDARSKALAQLHSLAASFQMDPQSQQFAELVAASYLPLVNILGEAATRAALQELATGVFFLQHQTMLTAITAASDSKRNNSTAVPQS